MKILVNYENALKLNLKQSGSALTKGVGYHDVKLLHYAGQAMTDDDRLLCSTL